MAYWVASQIADGTLAPAAGTHIIWADLAYDLGHPEELEPLISFALMLDDWQERWEGTIEELNRETVEAAKQLLSKRSTAEAGS